MPLSWDGSELGDITNEIGIIEQKPNLLVELRNEKGYLTFYKDSILLIADELKPLFGLEKIGRHKCIYNGEPAILHRKKGMEYTAVDYDSIDIKKDIQRSFAFRWILGLVQNYENTLIVRKFKSGIVCATSFVETKYDYLKTDSKGSVIPKTCLRKWFGDLETFERVVSEMVKNETYLDLRFKIEKIIRRISKENVYWTTLIMNRIGKFLLN